MERENRYFDFLCVLVGRSQEYIMLLDELHKIEFYSLIPNDDNRGADGLQLRHMFLDELGKTGFIYLPRLQCTVLEMLIGLAYRLEFETSQSKWEKTVSEWFWILIDNLCLTGCDEEAYFADKNMREDVKRVINIMLSREYNYDGNGGLFPLKNPKKDQRRIEIWYQMTSYIIENYPIEF